MLVSLTNYKDTIEKLKSFNVLAVDTETTGLRPYLGDSLFSIIISADDENTFYFNYQEYGVGFDKNFILPRHTILELQPLFLRPNLVFMHNAKFDMAMLAKEGLYFDCEIHDTEVGARIVYNTYLDYSLAECAKREGLKKDDAVDDYITEHKLWEWEAPRAGKKKREKKKFFNKVPPHVIVPYGKKDADVTRTLGFTQIAKIQKLNDELPAKPLNLVYANEKRLTRVCFAMEREGLRTDPEYCRKASAYELNKMEKAAQQFQDLTGIYFVDSAKILTKAFEKFGVRPGKTELGNNSFTDDVLANIKHPIAECVLTFRKSSKRRNTYYENFLTLADSSGLIHANIKQTGTKNTRFSMTDPNLQNVPKRDEDDEDAVKEPFTIRKAIIPVDGAEFYEIDFKAMEFRMMLDYAKEKGLIREIISGLDPHQATANLTGLPRGKAKTLNFGLLYGMGIKLLSEKLKCTEEDAKRFKRQYFDALSYVGDFIKQAMYTAKQRGFVHNWAGRRYYFDDPNFAYKAPNAVIQGGCAETMKFSMVKIFDYLALKKVKSSMIVQVHDSLLLQVFPNEADILPEILNILRTAYPHKLMPMDVSVKKSKTSWDDMVDFKF